MEEELLHRQALAMAIQQHQLSQRFDNGSMSRRIGSTSSRRRAANLSDPFSSASAKQQVNFSLFILLLLSKKLSKKKKKREVMICYRLCLFKFYAFACVQGANDWDLKGQKSRVLAVICFFFFFDNNIFNYCLSDAERVV